VIGNRLPVIGFEKPCRRNVCGAFSIIITDAGYWMPDTGCRILDTGYWMLDTGCNAYDDFLKLIITINDF
jgi:hypothetical protein